MSKFTQRQMELQSEMASLSNCRAQLRDLWLKNASADLLVAMESILGRLKIAEQELESVIEARDISESLSSKTAVPSVTLRLRL